MSWPTVINFSSGNWATWYYEIQASTTTSGRYNLYDSSGVSIDSGNNDIEFTISGSIITLNVNPPTQGSQTPTAFKIGTGTTVYTSNTVVTGDSITLFDGSSPQGIFTVPSLPTTSSGPTVTSHYWVDLTSNAKIVTSDTVQSSDLTFLKGTNSYTPNNITLVAISSGYVYDYQYSDTDLYTATIDSKSVSNFFLDTSWTSSPQSYTGRSTNSNRILNVLGTIPNTVNFTVSNIIWTSTTREFGNNSRNMFFKISKIGSTAAPTTEVFIVFYLFANANDIKAAFVGYTYEGDNITGKQSTPTAFTVGAQPYMTHTFNIDGTNTIITVPDWVYEDEPEGDGYVPVTNTTTSNGGGKPDRYPLIMTNLFNRNRSLYSIGMTHKDTWDLFL